MPLTEAQVALAVGIGRTATSARGADEQFLVPGRWCGTLLDMRAIQASEQVREHRRLYVSPNFQSRRTARPTPNFRRLGKASALRCDHVDHVDHLGPLLQPSPATAPPGRRM